jgi:hypothetical protein
MPKKHTIKKEEFFDLVMELNNSIDYWVTSDRWTDDSPPRNEVEEYYDAGGRGHYIIDVLLKYFKIEN